MTKESTHLFKDIYNEVRSTLRKYDEIVKENQINRQKNIRSGDSPAKSDKRRSGQKAEAPAQLGASAQRES